MQVEFRDDGSLFVYQPSTDVVLGATRARDLVAWLFAQAPKDMGRDLLEGHVPQSTVPDGVINTSAGPSETEESIARGVKDVEAGRESELDPVTHKAMIDALDETDTDKVIDPKPTPRRRGRPRKTT